jgi:hypothetical protein
MLMERDKENDFQRNLRIRIKKFDIMLRVRDDEFLKAKKVAN